MTKILSPWLIVDALAIANFFYLPFWVGEAALFGVPIASTTYRTEGRRILRHYWLWLSTTFITAQVLGIAAANFLNEAQIFYAHSAILLLLIVASFGIYGFFYRQIRPFELVDANPRI